MNDLTVTGPRKVMEAFDKAFKGKEAKWGLQSFDTDGKTEEEVAELQRKYDEEYEKKEQMYHLNSLYPVPPEILDNGYSNMKGFDGYTWSVNNWGTKWDIDGAAMGDYDEYFMYSFATAWAPPSQWVEHVSKDWKELEFSLDYEEGGMQFAGTIVFQNGEILDEEEREYVDEVQDEDQDEDYANDYDGWNGNVDEAEEVTEVLK